MYYITLRTSQTGQKFSALIKKEREIRSKQLELSHKYGFSRWTDAPFQIAGQISEVSFEKDTEINPKVWKKSRRNHFYEPKLNSKQGKEIYADFQNLPIIRWQDLNACIGADDISFHIGFNNTHSEYIGFTAQEDWEIEVPEDCQEITSQKWKEIFKKNR